eukprot:6196161-Pleurochrysis_carterae.AAC.2
MEDAHNNERPLAAGTASVRKREGRISGSVAPRRRCSRPPARRAASCVPRCRRGAAANDARAG